MENKTTTNIIQPHGNKLTSLFVSEKNKDNLCEWANNLFAIKLSSCELSDLIMLGIGAFSPLEGFMNKDDYHSVMENMHLADGTVWPIPITLSIDQQMAKGVKEGQDIALVDAERNEIVAALQLENMFVYDKKKEAVSVFGTADGDHPGVKKLYEQGDVHLGGPVKVLSLGGYPDQFPEFATCSETRKIFGEMNFKTVAAFQTRNPIHRSHEYLTKMALEVCDGLFIHPIVGKLKAGDVPAHVRMQCYRTMLDKYYPQDRVVLKVYPMEMRYAGPKEAVLHAIIRQNYGCSHLIVGRDHAGVGSYYGPFEAQDIFDRFNDSELAIKPLKLDWTFWCYKCGGMASKKTCPHSSKDRLMISGTELRQMLSRGKKPPEEFSRPEVIKILMDYYQTLEN